MIYVSFRPLQACWSKMEFYFELTYSGLALGKNIQVQVLNYDSGAVISDVKYPCTAASGILRVPMANELVDQELNYTWPANWIGTPAVLGAAQDITPGNRLRYRLRFRPIYPGSAEPWTYDTLPHYLIKGGIDDMRITHEHLTNQFGYEQALFYPNGKKFLTWIPNGRAVSPTEMHWLTYMSDISSSSISVTYYVLFTDGSSYTKNISLPDAVGDNKWKLWHIPAGVTQCSLNPSGKRINYYIVRVNHLVQTEYKFYVDYRADYTSITLYYVNSIGGIDHIRFRGDVELNGATFLKKSFNSTRRNATKGQDGYYHSEGRIKFKANTGFLNEAHMTALFDLYNAKEAAIVFYDNLLHVRIPEQDMKPVNKRNNLHDFTIEFETAGTFKNFPRQLASLIA